MKRNNGLLIAILTVGVLILVMLTLNFAVGGSRKNGNDGKSAYEIAVENGYTGSVTEWLASLGGRDGKSAYEIAVENGFTGSEKEWLLSLAFGENGKDGKDGQDGKDGANGKNGRDGEDGRDGTNGVGIKSVFVNSEGHLIVILDNGNRVDAGIVGGGATEENDFARAQENGFDGTVYDWLLTYLEGQHTNQSVTESRRDRKTGHLIVTLSDGSAVDAGYIPADGFLSDTLTDGFRPCFETVRVRSGSLRLRTEVGVFEGNNIAKIATDKEYLICTGKRADAGTGGDVYYRFRVPTKDAYVDCYAKEKYFYSKYATAEESSGINLPDSLVLRAATEMRLVRDEMIPWADDTVTLNFSGKGLTIRADADNAVFTLLAPEVGDYTLRAELRDGAGTLCEVRSLPVRVIGEKTVTGVRGLLIGDSRINRGTAIDASLTKELAGKTQSGVTWIGSVKTDGIACEGYGGWRAEDFVSEKGGTNPFWNPTTECFDFEYYLAKTNETHPDFVILNLGLNDEYSADSVRNLKKMVDSIRLTGTKVLLLTEYVRVPAEDGYDVSLLSRFSFTYFGKLRDAFSGREKESIYLVPNYLVVDPTADFADAVHLTSDGYRYEAEVIVTYLTDLFGT